MQNLPDYYTVRLSGDIASVEECRVFSGFIKTLFQEGNKLLLLDFQEVREVSGSVSGFLTDCIGLLSRSGGRILITNAAPAVEDVLSITGFEDRLISGVIARARTDLRALLVEDDWHVRDLTHEYLKELGFHVVESADGADGLVKYSMLRHHIDLVFSDIEMPVMDGLDLFRNIHGLNPSARVVMATGYAHSDKINMIKDIRNIPVLRKPYLPAEFEIAVRSVFETHTLNGKIA